MEQESEKRAQDEADLDNSDVEINVPNEDSPVTITLPIPGNANRASLTEGAAAAAGPSTLPLKDKRRASVLMSVFGRVCYYIPVCISSRLIKSLRFKQSEASLANPDEINLPLSMSPLATAASKSAFYHSLVNVSSISFSCQCVTDSHLQSQSVGTLSGRTNGHEDEDENHVTRMQTIAGRRSSISRTVDKLLSNTSRRKRTLLLPVQNPNVEIGVSVEEEEAPIEVEGNAERAKAYADTGNVLRTRRSLSWRQNIPNALAPGSLVTRARGFTLKFRRKSESELLTSDGRIS